MRYVLLSVLLLHAGCVPALESERRLIEQSKKGVRLVRTSVDQRAAWVAGQHGGMRDALDDGFDTDVHQHVGELSSEWVIEARKGYVVAARALEASRLASQQSADVDRQNLDAIDTCLTELETLNRAQLNAVAPLTEKLK